MLGVYDEDKTVSANSQMTIAENSCQLRRLLFPVEKNAFSSLRVSELFGTQDDEIVAQPMHFVKGQGEARQTSRPDCRRTLSLFFRIYCLSHRKEL